MFLEDIWPVQAIKIIVYHGVLDRDNKPRFILLDHDICLWGLYLCRDVKNTSNIEYTLDYETTDVSAA